MSYEKTTTDQETGHQIAPIVLRRFDWIQAPVMGSLIDEMDECNDGDFVKYEDAKVVIEKLTEAVDALLIGVGGVGVPHKGERELLQECVNTAIRLKREAVGGKAAT